MTTDWPFVDPPDRLAISVRQVTDKQEPIVYAFYSNLDREWQFLGPSKPEPDDLVPICLGHVLELDPTIGEIADMGPGWKAFRDSAHAPWQREFHPESDDP